MNRKKSMHFIIIKFWCVAIVYALSPVHQQNLSFNPQSCADFVNYLKDNFIEFSKMNNQTVSETIEMDFCKTIQPFIKICLFDKFSDLSRKKIFIEKISSHQFMIELTQASIKYMMFIEYDAVQNKWSWSTSQTNLLESEQLKTKQADVVSGKNKYNIDISEEIREFEEKFNKTIQDDGEIKSNIYKKFNNLLNQFLSLSIEERNDNSDALNNMIKIVSESILKNEQELNTLLLKFYIFSKDQQNAKKYFQKIVQKYIQNHCANMNAFHNCIKYLTFFSQKDDELEKAMIQNLISMNSIICDRSFSKKLFDLVNALNINAVHREFAIECLIKLKKNNIDNNKIKYIDKALLRFYSAKGEVNKIQSQFSKKFSDNKNFYTYHLLMSYQIYFEMNQGKMKQPKNAKMKEKYEEIIRKEVINNNYFEGILHCFDIKNDREDSSKKMIETFNENNGHEIVLTERTFLHILNNHVVRKSHQLEKKINSYFNGIGGKELLDIIQEGMTSISSRLNESNNDQVVHYLSPKRRKKYGFYKILFVISNGQIITCYPLTGRKEKVHVRSYGRDVYSDLRSAYIGGEESIFNLKIQKKIYYLASDLDGYMFNDLLWSKKVGLISLDKREVLLKDALMNGKPYQSMFNKDDRYLVYEIPSHLASQTNVRTIVLKIDNQFLSEIKTYPFAFAQIQQKIKFFNSNFSILINQKIKIRTEDVYELLVISNKEDWSTYIKDGKVAYQIPFGDKLFDEEILGNYLYILISEDNDIKNIVIDEDLNNQLGHCTQSA